MGRPIQNLGRRWQLPATDIEINGSAVKFVMDWGGPVNFNGKIAGDTMSGELVSQYYSGTWSVQRKKAKSPSAALGGR